LPPTTHLETRIMNRESSRRLIVIGASANPDPDQVPLYMDPICTDPADPQACYLANVAPWDGSHPRLSYVPHERFEEECEQGYWLRLEQSFPFRWDHRLVALEPGRPPTYLPDERAYAEVERLGMEALATVARDLERHAWTQRAHERLWYAVRALGDDPLPLLTAIALERGDLPVETLNDLIEELPPPSGRLSPLGEHARSQGWTELLALVEQDPLGQRYFSAQEGPVYRKQPEFLKHYPDNNGFLKKNRVLSGQASYPRAA
jgi:hypothetical protein